MKTYTFKVVIKEGNDEFWEELIARGSTGCEEVQEELEKALYSRGFLIDTNCSLVLEKYENADV